MNREIIEQQGWKFKATNGLTEWFRMEISDIPDFSGNARDYYRYPIYGMLLMWSKDDNKIKIYMNFTGTSDEIEQKNDDKMFEGEIKDEKALVTIMKWLKIKAPE